MTLLSLTKKAISFCLLLSFLLIGASQAADVGEGLFTSYEGPLRLDPQSVNPAIVLRQRLVTIRFELLPRAEGQEVTLNLFDDVVVRAICDGLETNVSGGFVWNGHTHDQARGLVTFTIVDQALAGTVQTPDLIYHIRPFQDQVHVIREIRPPVRRTVNLLDDAGPSSVEQEVANLVNLERAIVSLHPLAWDDALGTAARGHSTDMAQQNYFNHTSLDGRTFSQRIAAAGYAYSSCAENIAAGYSTAQVVMNGWMNSSGHRANILSSNYCDIGVGYAYGPASTYGHYWTQDFGRRLGVSVCTPTEYTITATAGLHGTITPSGSVKVYSGANQTFQITPDPGYRILEVMIDGVSIGAVATYTFESVTRNHSIAAYFQHVAASAKPAPWIPLLLFED